MDIIHFLVLLAVIVLVGYLYHRHKERRRQARYGTGSLNKDGSYGKQRPK